MIEVPVWVVVMILIGFAMIVWGLIGMGRERYK